MPQTALGMVLHVITPWLYLKVYPSHGKRCLARIGDRLAGVALGGLLGLAVSRQQIWEARALRADEALRERYRSSVDRRFKVFSGIHSSAPCCQRCIAVLLFPMNSTLSDIDCLLINIAKTTVVALPAPVRHRIYLPHLLSPVSAYGKIFYRAICGDRHT
jgi:hypothetical protein